MVPRITRRVLRLLRHAATDWRYLFYKAYVPVWRYSMARKGVDLSPASHEELGLPPDIAYEYEDSEAPFLAEVLRRLEIGPGDAVLDFGSGKGGALVTLSGFPFRRVAGVDLSPKMVETARRNLDRLGLDRIDLYCGDAAAFTRIDDFTHFYFFNPFPETVMRAVLRNIMDSARRRPRQITLIYCNPVCHETLAADPDVHLEWSYFNFNVYSVCPASCHSVGESRQMTDATK